MLERLVLCNIIIYFENVIVELYASSLKENDEDSWPPESSEVLNTSMSKKPASRQKRPFAVVDDDDEKEEDEEVSMIHLIIKFVM
jgi:hypothetical protein